jgi:hypothetical protein
MKGITMRYLAIIFLSLMALLGAAGTSAGAEEVTLQASVVPVTELLTRRDVVAPGTDGGAPMVDGALTALLGFALVALQLRRRQKSMRMPRAFYG